MEHPSVSQFINTSKQWQNVMAYLRQLVLQCGLIEEWKWKQPCYTDRGKNICIISPRKDSIILGFFKGTLIQDLAGYLESPGENSHHSRYLQFRSVADIEKLECEIKAYIFEAIEIERAGLRVEAAPELIYPDELKVKLSENDSLKKAFEALTKGRQRGYVLHFSQAKQSSTRINRIDKFMPRILNGYGMNDCVCGKSKRMPNCDGSHNKR